MEQIRTWYNTNIIRIMRIIHNCIIPYNTNYSNTNIIVSWKQQERFLNKA